VVHRSKNAPPLPCIIFQPKSISCKTIFVIIPVLSFQSKLFTSEKMGLEVSQTIKKKGEPLVAPPGGGTAPALCIVSDPNNSIHFHFDLHI